MFCTTSVLDRKRGTSASETQPISINSHRNHPNKYKRRSSPNINDWYQHAGSINTVTAPHSPFFKLPPSSYSPSTLDKLSPMDLFEQDFDFEIPAYTPSQSSLATSYLPGAVRTSRTRQRYAPYMIPQRSIHKMNIYYVDPAYIEESREVFRPAAPEPALDAILHPPQFERRFIVAGLGLFNRVLGFLAGHAQNLRRTVLA